MATLEAGLFVAMLIVSFGLMVISFKFGYPTSALTRLISIGVFMGITVLLVSGYGVTQTSSVKNVTTGDQWNESDPWIPENGGGTWLGYIFLGFTILNFFWLVKETWSH